MNDAIQVQVKKGDETLVLMEADVFRCDLFGDLRVLVVIKAERPSAEQLRILDHVHRIIKELLNDDDEWGPK